MKKLTTDQRLKTHQPLEVWKSFDGQWTWEVYKKYQKPENEKNNPYARWLCRVKSPIVPEGEIGDVYVHEIKRYARKVTSYTSGELFGAVIPSDIKTIFPKQRRVKKKKSLISNLERELRF